MLSSDAHGVLIKGRRHGIDAIGEERNEANTDVCHDVYVRCSGRCEKLPGGDGWP